MNLLKILIHFRTTCRFCATCHCFKSKCVTWRDTGSVTSFFLTNFSCVLVFWKSEWDIFRTLDISCLHWDQRRGHLGSAMPLLTISCRTMTRPWKLSMNSAKPKRFTFLSVFLSFSERFSHIFFFSVDKTMYWKGAYFSLEIMTLSTASLFCTKTWSFGNPVVWRLPSKSWKRTRFIFTTDSLTWKLEVCPHCFNHFFKNVRSLL